MNFGHKWIRRGRGLRWVELKPTNVVWAYEGVHYLGQKRCHEDTCRVGNTSHAHRELAMHLGNLKNSIHVHERTCSETSLWHPPLGNNIIMAAIQGLAAFQGFDLVTMEVYVYVAKFNLDQSLWPLHSRWQLKGLKCTPNQYTRDSRACAISHVTLYLNRDGVESVDIDSTP